MSRRNITSGSAFESQIGYSRAVVSGSWVLVSGTTGYNYQTGVISPSIVVQTEQTLKNIATALEQSGATISDVVQVKYILSDGGEFPQTWPALRRYFGGVKPAATMIQAKLMNDEMKIEIEVWARKQKATKWKARL